MRIDDCDEPWLIFRCCCCWLILLFNCLLMRIYEGMPRLSYCNIDPNIVYELINTSIGLFFYWKLWIFIFLFYMANDNDSSPHALVLKLFTLLLFVSDFFVIRLLLLFDDNCCYFIVFLLLLLLWILLLLLRYFLYPLR